MKKVSAVKNSPNRKRTGPASINGSFVDIRTASQLTGLARSLIYQRVKAGTIPHRRLGNRLIFDPNELKTWFTRLPGISVEDVFRKVAS